MEFIPEYPYKEEIYQYVGASYRPILHALSGITYSCPDYEIVRHNPKAHSLEYVYEGEGVIQENDKIQKIRAGDFFILHPNMYHHYFSSPKNPWKKIWLVVDGNTDYITALLKAYNLDNVMYLPQCNTPFSLEKIFHLVKNDDGNIHHTLEKLILDLIMDISDYIIAHTLDTSPIVVAKRFIDKRINTRILISEVSAYVHMNPTHFGREFKKMFGLSPIQYILQTKVENSKALLLQTQMTVQEIADYFGFTDPAHYIRTFIRYTGITPKNYRKQF